MTIKTPAKEVSNRQQQSGKIGWHGREAAACSKALRTLHLVSSFHSANSPASRLQYSASVQWQCLVRRLIASCVTHSCSGRASPQLDRVPLCSSIGQCASFSVANDNKTHPVNSQDTERSGWLNEGVPQWDGKAARPSARVPQVAFLGRGYVWPSSFGWGCWRVS